MRHQLHALIVAVMAATVLLPAIPVHSQTEYNVDRFTVTDAQDDQQAPRVDGRWIVYEDGRRSEPMATATPTQTPQPAATATETPTEVPPTEVPATSTPETTSTPVAHADALLLLKQSRQVTDQMDIRVYDLETGEHRRLTDTSNARDPDVSGSLAVWAELSRSGSWSVIVYDLDDRTIAGHIEREGDQQRPAISGRRVVWQDNRRGNWDIRAYDFDGNREFWISDSSQEETNPAIDGDLVAFERDGLIWYRDLSTDTLNVVEGVGGYEPSVSGERIAFRSGGTRAEPIDASIYVFDRRDGSLTQVSTVVDGRRGNPRISGDLVTWWDRREGSRDIFAYDLVTQTEIQIAGDSGDQDQPDLASGATTATIVWVDRRGADANVRGAYVDLPGDRGSLEPADESSTDEQQAPVDPSPPAPRDGRYFPTTGFRVDNDAIWEYFNLRGGVKNFGYPVSRTFSFLGFTTQFFQRHIVQIGPEGPRLLNLLDPELMPYTTINTSTFPPYDPDLAGQAPPVGSPGYDTAVIEFLRQHAPDQVDGHPVRFYETFANQVDFATAFPSGNGNPDLLPGINLELAGTVTSRPLTDPNNPNFIYQRFQRVIFHYDATCSCTQPILLADYFKAILTGENVPPDLAEQASGSRFYGQYNNAVPGGLNRPDLLPATDMSFAFEPQ